MSRTQSRRLVSLAVVAAAGLAACSSSGSSPGTTGTTPSPTSTAAGSAIGTPIGPVPAPTYTPADFGGAIDNPYYPLLPGSRWVYRGVEDGDRTRDVVTVTHKTKVLDGVTCAVIHDYVYTNGKLSEPTSDYYAQDNDGNVWYFGEDTAEVDPNGHVTSREGSWHAGVDGATAGLFMPAQPAVGQEFQQEFYRGQAEDRFRIISLDSTVTTPQTGTSSSLVTEEWSPLEPKIYEHKWYVSGIGNVKENVVRGPHETQSLVSFTHG